jgi:hypothetical protein
MNVRTRRGSRTPTDWFLRPVPLPLGYPGMVRRGDAGSRTPMSGVQDRRSTVEPQPHGASDPDRTGYLPGTGRAHCLQCFAGVSPLVLCCWSPRRESNSRRPLTRRLHDRRAARAVRTPGRIRTGTVGLLKTAPPAVGLRGRQRDRSGPVDTTSGYGESNPGIHHGRVAHFRCATTACCTIRELRAIARSRTGDFCRTRTAL